MFANRLGINRIKIHRFQASRSTAKTSDHLLHVTSNYIGNLLDDAKNYGVTIHFNNINKPVTKIEKIAEKIAPYDLQNQEKTLLRLKKAIIIINECAQQRYKYEDLNISYQYNELNLGKLTREYLVNPDLQNKANDFLKSVDLVGSLNLLRELDATERVYGSPILSLGSLSWTASDINKLAAKWFGKLINDALMRSDVRLNFNECQIITLEGLAKKISHLVENGRTLLLIRRAVNNINALSFYNAGKPLKYILDLGRLTPAHLKEKNITDKEIDDMIDSTAPKTITDFLIKAGALVIEEVRA